MSLPLLPVLAIGVILVNILDKKDEKIDPKKNDAVSERRNNKRRSKPASSRSNPKKPVKPTETPKPKTEEKVIEENENAETVSPNDPNRGGHSGPEQQQPTSEGRPELLEPEAPETKTPEKETPENDETSNPPDPD